MADMRPINEYLPIAEAAARVDVSTSWLTKLVNDGKIDGHKIGRQWLVHPDEAAKAPALKKRNAKVPVDDRLERIEAELLAIQERLERIFAVLISGVGPDPDADVVAAAQELQPERDYDEDPGPVDPDDDKGDWSGFGSGSDTAPDRAAVEA